MKLITISLPSSNGRTMDFDSINKGSIPFGRDNKVKMLPSSSGRTIGFHPINRGSIPLGSIFIKIILSLIKR